MPLGELVSVTYVIEDYFAQREEGDGDEVEDDGGHRGVETAESFGNSLLSYHQGKP